MLQDLPLFLEITIISGLGLIFGSFATALTYRIPKGIPWAFETDKNENTAYRSACTSCGEKLTTLDLIPLVSWALSKGKCRHCKTKISALYPLIELTTLAMCLISYTVYGFSIPLFWILVSIPFLSALIFIDIKHLILPNQLVLIVFVLGLCLHASSVIIGNASLKTVILNFATGAFIYAIFAWLLGVITSKILKKEALGFGDVKFFAVAGVWLGVMNLPYFCLLSGILGVFLALAWRITFKKHIFPFGPALILAFFVLFLLQGSQWNEFILK